LIIKFLHKKSLEKEAAERERIQPVIQEGIQGLTESEAEALRIEGQHNAVSFEHQRTMKDILRDNVVNIFNLSLLGVASVQFMLGMFWDGLLSLLVALLNIGIQVGQELFIIRLP
jgi:magnesium-transporting ATPase (P-type)